MTTVHVVLAGAIALSTAANALAQSVPNFSGRWRLDSSVVMGGGRGDARGNASGGGGGGGGGTGLGPPPGYLDIKQDDKTLTVKESDGHDDAATFIYKLDGTARKNEMRVGRGRSTQAKYTSRVDGSRIVTSITFSMGSRAFEFRESRHLSGDGSMVVQLNMLGQAAGRTVVYQKVP